MKLTQKSRIIVAIALFTVLFGALLTLATFFDLQVSDILTADALADGAYLADDFFGVTFEILGSSPVYLMIDFCLVILFWYFVRFVKNKPLKYILAVVCLAGGVAAFWFFMKDILNYCLEHFGAEITGANLTYEQIHEIEDKPYVIGTEVLVALFMSVIATLAGKNFKDETLKKLLKFVIAFILTAIVANVIVAIVKVPVGRMRYRAMNSTAGQAMGGFDNFTRWYIMTGNNDIYDSKALFEVSDAFKSFPSGHTCAAGMCYGLIMLKDVLEIKNKWQKLGIYLATVTFTGIVAISRIVVGAHFFSDVLIGGTLSFVSMAIFRETIINKCANIKALFKKSQPLGVTESIIDSASTDVEAETVETAETTEKKAEDNENVEQ